MPETGFGAGWPRNRCGWRASTRATSTKSSRPSSRSRIAERMLTELRVENLGIIAELCVPLGTGLTVITGETGAGKTLLVDALELLCGARADPNAVRDGADEARVEGRFVVGDEDFVFARVVPREGRSRGYVN